MVNDATVASRLGGGGSEPAQLMRGRDVAAAVGRSPSKVTAPGRSLLVYVGAFCLLVTQLDNIQVMRKLVLLLPVLALVAALAYRRTRKVSVKPTVPLALTGFVIWLSLSYAWSVDRYNSSHQILETLLVSIAGAIIACTLDRSEVIRVIAVAARVAIVITSVGLVVAYHWSTKIGVGGAPGWHGPFGQKNGLGFAMEFGLIAMYFETVKPKRYRLWMLLGVVLVVGSSSGAALGGTLIAATFVAWFHFLTSSRRLRDRIVLIAATVVSITVAVVLLVTEFPFVVGLLGKNATLTGRTRIWAAVIHAFTTNPIHGFGYGAVWLNSTGETAKLWQAIGFKAYEAHDVYLDTLLQLGVVGLILLGGTLLTGLVSVIRRLRAGDPVDRWLFLCFVALIIEGVVESDLLGDTMFLVALLVTAAVIHGRDRRPALVRVGRVPGASAVGSSP